MATKNFTMKSNNGTGWDTLHPKTNMAQVEGLSAKIDEIDAIAKGASKAKVFDTVADLNSWLSVAANKATLQIGDNLLIRANDTPDYWWDGEEKQELESSKITLVNASTTEDGLMSKGDFTKLAGIATGATKVTTPSDIGAATAAQGTKADNAVPNTRKINNKALSTDITLDADDVSAVPTTRKVNGKVLSADITLDASDIGAATAAQGAKADTAIQSIPFETSASNIKAAGTAAAGTSGKVADAAHVHPVQTTVSGNAGTATKLAASKTFELTGDVTGSVSSDLSGSVSIAATQVANRSNQKVAVSKNSTTATGTRKQVNFKDGSNITVTVADNATNDAVDITIAATNTTYNAATTSANGLMSSTDKAKLDGIAEGAQVNPSFETTASNIKAAGTAAVGSLSTVARADHIHPAQTTISGNAGTSTKLATARTISIGTGATGTATSFDGSANITIPITAVNANYISSGTLPAARLGVPVITVGTTAPESPKVGDIWYDENND